MAGSTEGAPQRSRQQPRRDTLAGLRLVYRANPRLATQLLVASVVLGLMPTLFTLASGSLVGAAHRGGHVLVPLLVVAVAFLVGDAGSNFTNALIEGFREQVEASRRARVMAAALAPAGVSHVEDEETLDLIRHGAENEWPNTSAFTLAVYGIVRLRVTALISAVLVLRFRWWLGLGLVALWLVV